MASQQELIGFLTYPNETLASEYKSWLDLTANKGKATLAKAAIALANHGGGTIVIGMRGEGSEKLGSRPRPNEIPRYTTDAVNAAINRYADPAMHYDVSFEVHPETGVEHAFISVPPSTVPVMSTRLEEKVIAQNRCYIRKAGPKSEEPNSAEEWRTLFNRCIQAGRETMLDSIRNILEGHTLTAAVAPKLDRLTEFSVKAKTRWETLRAGLQPTDRARFENGYYAVAFEIVDFPEIALGEMRDRLRLANAIALTGWSPFIDVGRGAHAPNFVDGMIEVWLGENEEGNFGGRYADFWRATGDGMFYLLRGYGEDFHSKLKPGQGMDATSPIWRIGETLLFIARLAGREGTNPLIKIRVEYTGLKGRTMAIYFDFGISMRPGVSAMDVIVLEGQATVAEVSENLPEVLHSLTKPFYDAFEFSSAPLHFIRDQLSKLRRG